MSEFTDIYKELVILQYYQKEKAQGEIKVYSDEFENVYSFLNEFFTQFDVDLAWSDRLDLIGKIVGISRIVEGGVAKKFFGYEGAANVLGYDSGRYFVTGDNLYTDSELTDGQYRIFIKAKISKNNASAVLVSDERDGLQASIQLLFDGSGYVTDNQDMSLNLYLSDTVPEDDLLLILQADLLPKPQAVRYRWIVKIDDDTPFGYEGAPNAAGYDSGKYAHLGGYDYNPVLPIPDNSYAFSVFADLISGGSPADVEGWVDSVGSDDLVQLTPADQPLFNVDHIEFDGSNHLEGLQPQTGDFTYVIKYKYTGVGLFIMLGDSGGSNNVAYINGNNIIYRASNGTQIVLASGVNLHDSQTRSLTLRRSGTTVSLYVDGIPADSDTVALSDFAPDQIGKWHDSNFQFVGDMNDLLLYYRALSDSEVLSVVTSL